VQHGHVAESSFAASLALALSPIAHATYAFMLTLTCKFFFGRSLIATLFFNASLIAFFAFNESLVYV
jgi:hypothetical protein